MQRFVVPGVTTFEQVQDMLDPADVSHPPVCYGCGRTLAADGPGECICPRTADGGLDRCPSCWQINCGPDCPRNESELAR